jgi:hypothetical protein
MSDGQDLLNQCVELCACNFGEHGGWFFEVWRLEPCCGQPANLGDALRCGICWCTCFGFCSMSALFAHSLSQPLSVVNHCLTTWLLSPCILCASRHNFRMKHSIGPLGPEGWVSDFLCAWFLGPCTLCQILRASDGTDYDWLTKTSEGLMCTVSPITCCAEYSGVQAPNASVGQAVRSTSAAFERSVDKMKPSDQRQT